MIPEGQLEIKGGDYVCESKQMFSAEVITSLKLMSNILG